MDNVSAETLNHFGDKIDRLIQGTPLSRAETREAVLRILDNSQSEIHQGAFLAAITAKGPTPDEIAGAWEAIYEVDTTKVSLRTDRPVVDNCGTGMDGFKTFNISTAAAVVAAAGGVDMARHGARAVTSACGTVDLCEALGVDVECPVGMVRESIEKAGIGLFNGMSAEVHPTALFRILSRMRFGSILNIAASLANPANPRRGVRGVYDPAMVRPVAETMRAIGFERALVFHGNSGNGVGGMDELSPVAASIAAELTPDGAIREFTLPPEAVGLRFTGSLKTIAAAAGPEEEALRLLRIFSGQDRGGCFETVCLNSAPVFYIAGLTDDLSEGVAMARRIIASGQAHEKLRAWVRAQNRNPDGGLARLEALENRLRRHR